MLNNKQTQVGQTKEKTEDEIWKLYEMSVVRHLHNTLTDRLFVDSLNLLHSIIFVQWCFFFSRQEHYYNSRGVNYNKSTKWDSELNGSQKCIFFFFLFRTPCLYRAFFIIEGRLVRSFRIYILNGFMLTFSFYEAYVNVFLFYLQIETNWYFLVQAWAQLKTNRIETF